MVPIWHCLWFLKATPCLGMFLERRVGQWCYRNNCKFYLEHRGDISHKWGIYLLAWPLITMELVLRELYLCTKTLNVKVTLSHSLSCSYHDWDVQDPQLLFCWLMLGFFGWFLSRETWGTILVMDVKKQRAILQPLLPPAHQRDVLCVPWDL